MIRFIIAIFLFSCVLAAPATESLFKVVEKDPRTQKLRKNRFVAECKNNSENSKTLCYALYDVALSFDAQKLDFTTANVGIEQDMFCSALSVVLPDSAFNNDSVAAFNSSAQWFKDVLKKDDGNEFCKKSCFYFDQQAYEDKLTAACQFLLNQFTFLKNQNAQNIQPALKDDESKTVVLTSGSAEVTSKDKEPSKTEDVKIAPASMQASFPVAAVSQQLKNLTAPKSAEVVKESVVKAVTTPNVAAPLDESGTIIGSQASKPQTSPLVPLDASKVANSATSDPNKASSGKPIVESVNLPLTPELTKGESSPKTNDLPEVPEIPLDETNNAENQDIFDNGEIISPEGDAAEKEPEKTVDNPNYDEDTDDYGDNLDPMVKNNPNNPPPPPANKLPQEPELVVEEVPQKKVEYVNFEEDPDSNFFTYLCALMFLCVLLYIVHQNRHKLLALCLEGRRGRRGRERSRGGSKAAYSKLDCNLEEAIMSKKSLSGKSMDIIY